MGGVAVHPYGHGQGAGANSVIGKTRLILEAFAIDDVNLSLSQLARRTGVSKASVYRLAQELLEWGMLERHGAEYRLGMRAFELGSRVPRFRVLRDTVRPLMEQLHQSIGETVHLSVLDGHEVLYLEKIGSTTQSSRPSRIAGRMPLHCTATGKALMAFSSPQLLQEVVARGLSRVSASTVAAPGLLADQLQIARQRGFAVEREETAVGYTSVAVPLFGSSGLLLAALSITAPAFRSDVDRFGLALLEVQRRLHATRMLN